MGFSVMLWGAKNLVPAEYWCPYCTRRYFNVVNIVKNVVAIDNYYLIANHTNV